MTLIEPTEDYIAQLRALVKPPETLAKHGYTMQALTEDELLLKRRCIGCGKSGTPLV
jgi:RNA exonuclease 1